MAVNPLELVRIQPSSYKTHAAILNILKAFNLGLKKHSINVSWKIEYRKIVDVAQLVRAPYRKQYVLIKTYTAILILCMGRRWSLVQVQSSTLVVWLAQLVEQK